MEVGLSDLHLINVLLTLSVPEPHYCLPILSLEINSHRKGLFKYNLSESRNRFFDDQANYPTMFTISCWS